MRYSPREYAAFEDDILKGHEARGPTHRITTDPQTGDRLLAAGATWDYILGHELYREGKVDVERVSEVLRPLARCDGQGPVFREGDVERAVRGCVEG
jgi:AP-1-like factor